MRPKAWGGGGCCIPLQLLIHESFNLFFSGQKRIHSIKRLTNIEHHLRSPKSIATFHVLYHPNVGRKNVRVSNSF